MIARLSVLSLLLLAVPAHAQEFLGHFSTGPSCQGMDAEISKSRIAVGPFECKVKDIRSRADGIFRVDGIQCRDEGDPAGTATLYGKLADGKVYFSWKANPDIRLYRCER
ncbi:hypothetical protein [Amorphus sp. MBR-141]